MPDDTISEKDLAELAENEGSPLVRSMAHELQRIRPLAAMWEHCALDLAVMIRRMCYHIGKREVNDDSLALLRGQATALLKRHQLQGNPLRRGTPSEAASEAMKAQKPEHTHPIGSCEACQAHDGS